MYVQCVIGRAEQAHLVVQVAIYIYIHQPTDQRIKCVLHMDLQGAPKLRTNVASSTCPQCVAFH